MAVHGDSAGLASACPGPSHWELSHRDADLASHTHVTAFDIPPAECYGPCYAAPSAIYPEAAIVPQQLSIDQ